MAHDAEWAIDLQNEHVLNAIIKALWLRNWIFGQLVGLDYIL